MSHFYKGGTRPSRRFRSSHFMKAERSSHEKESRPSSSSSLLASLLKYLCIFVTSVLIGGTLAARNENNNFGGLVSFSTAAPITPATPVTAFPATTAMPTTLAPLDYVYLVNKTRKWITNLDPDFRPNAAAQPPLTRFMNPIIPPRLMSNSLVMPVSGRLVTFGGMMSSKDNIDKPLAKDSYNDPYASGNPDAYHDRVMAYNIERNQWYDETPYTRGPGPRIDHVAWVWGDTMWIHGGAAASVYNDVYAYRNRTWKSYKNDPAFINTMPYRKGHTADVLDPLFNASEVFMFGGIDENGYVTDTFIKVNKNGVVTPIIQSKGPKPPARAYHASAVMRTKYDGTLLFISGGTDNKQVFADLYVYYTKNNSWRFLSDGSSPQTLAYEQDAIIPALTVPSVMKHSCVARFPLLFCVGGNPSEDPIAMGFDITLGRWVRQYFENLEDLLPLSGNKLVLYTNSLNQEEVLSVGGVSGRPPKFAQAYGPYIFKTALFGEQCPYEYVDGDYEGRCYLCDLGFGADRDLDPHRCFACPAGRYAASGRCWDCPTSTYNPYNTSEGVDSCTSCPGGYFTVSTGANRSSLCITCPPSTYAVGPECVDCPAGTYGNVWGAVHVDNGCLPCPFGSYSIEGQTSCTSCPAGTSTGPFVRNLEPYELFIVNVIQGRDPSGCSSTIPNFAVNPITAEENFWVTIGVKDYGLDGLGNGALRLNLAAWGNAASGLVANDMRNLNIEYSGAAQYVHMNCISNLVDPGPTCGSRRSPNETYTMIGRNGRGQTGLCGNDYTFTLPIRIADGGRTQLRLHGNGVKAVTLDLDIKQQPWVRIETMTRTLFLAQQDYEPFRVLAFSGGNIKAFMNYTGVTDLYLRVSCTAGGGGGINQRVIFTNGVFSPTIRFTARHTACFPFVINRFSQMAYQVDPSVRFDVQVANSFNITTVGTRAPNRGLFYVKVTSLQLDGTLATADSVSEVRVTVDDLVGIVNTTITAMIPRKHNVFMSERFIFVKVKDGVGIGAMHMYSTAARFNISTWSILRGTMFSGPIAAGLFDRTDLFWIVPNNGTRLKLVQTQYTFPTWISANTTFKMEVQLQSWDLLHDGTRDFAADVTMGGCAAVARVANISKYGPNRVDFKAGRAVITVYAQGHDTTGCFLRVTPVNAVPFILTLTTPHFDIITPKRLKHNFTCPAVPVYEGDQFIINVDMRSVTNKIANMTNMGVLMEVSGNSSAIIETSGFYVKPLVNGKAVFTIQYRPTLIPSKVVFWAGEWNHEAQYNYTYIINPYYQRITTFLGYENVFRKVGYIQIDQTCLILPVTKASQIRILSRTPRWTENNRPLAVDLEAVNIFGIRDTTFSSVISLRAKECNGGVQNVMKWEIMDPATQTKYTVKAPTTFMSSSSPWSGFLRFTNGVATAILYPSFITNANRTGGVKGCALVFSAPAVTPGIMVGFEVRHVFPSCKLCEPGTFSKGGDGRDATIAPYHTAGCMPCMVGTFSAESGATSEAFCEGCLSGYGMNWGGYMGDMQAYEGQIRCTGTCTWGSAGQVGGGPCQNIETRLAYQRAEGDWGNLGRIYRRCLNSGCQGAPVCPPGTFWLDCPALTTQANCLDPDNLGQCTWSAGTCQGPIVECTPCPAGTGQPYSVGRGNWKNVCSKCQAGGWQTMLGRSAVDANTWSYQRMYCGGAYVGSWWCSGADRKECWNGTYSATSGATSNDTCVACPSGHYCHQMPRYRAGNCQVSNCNPSVTGGNYICPNAGCYNCPLSNGVMEGATRPIPCPPGTYNNLTGQSDISACLRCWAGTYCPLGSTYPLVTDRNHTEQEMLGNLTPTAVSFYGSDDYVQCTNAIDKQDGSGYIEDGHFNRFPLYFKTNTGANWFPTDSYRSAWSGAFLYVTTDRFNNTNSMSIRTNSSRGGAFQRMRLAHELPIEMVARAWIKYALDNRNMSGVLPPSQYVKPFVGIEVTIEYEDELTGASGEVQQFTYFAQPSPSWEWQLLELNIVPTRPIRWATMQVAARGFYQGYALFDDISFRPAHDRICMCSTGFFYNASDPDKKCQRCKPGFACSGGTIQRCTNSWSCSSTAGCQYCRDGWLCDSDGRGRHIPCNKFTYKSNTTEQCFPCPMGYSCKDGMKYECNDGKYGDGGLECITCKPGYYAPKKGPQRQCIACPPGHTSEAGRSSCFKCPVNHYSPNGTDCYSADVGFFVPVDGSAYPISCTSPVMDNYTVTIPRNRHGYVIRVVPRICLNHYSYEASRSEDVANGYLGQVRLSKASAAVLYDAGAHNFPQDTHVFKVYFTSNVNAIEQYATVTVILTNTPMIGVDDSLWVPHPMEQDTTYRITTWLSNNVNTEHDWIWVQSVTAPVASPTATMAPPGTPRVAQFDMGLNPGALVGVDYSLNHPALTVTLPKGFRGPMHIRPITYDQFCPTLNADCLETSPHDVIRITARTRPPVAVNDFFRVQVGQVVPLDVLKNDFDYENDLIKIISTTASSQTGYFPAVQDLCASKTVATCNTACSTSRLYGAPCQCEYSTYEDRCRTVNPSYSQWFVDFASMTGACGLETFTYTIETNDGQDTGLVTIDNYRCYCDSQYYNYGAFNIIFVLDGTTSVSDYAAQLAFADGVIKRSNSNSNEFFYGIIETGSNRVNYALSTVHPDVLTMKRGDDGDEYIYSLGAGIDMAREMYLTGPRNTWVVVISTKEGADTLTNIQSRLPLARYITFSVNPLDEHYLHWGEHFTNIYYSRVLKDLATLNKEASIQEELMDLMCGAGWM